MLGFDKDEKAAVEEARQPNQRENVARRIMKKSYLFDFEKVARIPKTGTFTKDVGNDFLLS